MFLLIPMIPVPDSFGPISPDLKLENLVEDSGETILLSSKPNLCHQPHMNLLRNPKKDFKIKGSRFKFPPFYGKKGEHIFHPIINKASETA
jgi:hypothetical protein